jgi:hypothetical protein
MIRHAARTEHELGRREVLRQGLLWGGMGAVATGLATGSSRAAAASGPAVGASLVLDCALLGDTLRIIPAPGATPPNNLAGSVFVVEGLTYPAGTIHGDGFDPLSAPATGRWICRGWLINTPDRPQPAILSTQEYLLQPITAQRLFPPDQLASSGLEQAVAIPLDPSQPGIRSVIGGTGRYAGATGTVVQHFTGRNTSRIAGGAMGNGANFRFEFQLR